MRSRWWPLVALLPVMLLLAASPALAERPPIRRYTTADGLPSEDVARVRQDSQGFIWLATSEGVARFDGVEFVTYGRAEGLPVSAVNDILEARDGHLWIATNGGGVARMNPRAPQGEALLTVLRVGPDRASNRVNVLIEDNGGRIWAGTDSGVYRSDRPGESFEPFSLRLENVADRLVAIFAIARGAADDLWLATSHGVLQVLADGRIARYADPPGLSLPIITVLHDGNSLVWMGGASGLVAAREPSSKPSQSGEVIAWRRACVQRGPEAIPLPVEPGSVCPYDVADGLPLVEIRALHRTSDGRMLVSAIDGHVWEYTGTNFRTRLAPGDSASPLNGLTSDADGNIWIAARPGVIRIAQHGLVSFDRRDGLASGLPKAFVEDRDGVFYALSRDSHINRWNGERFVVFRPPLPLDVRPTSWSNQVDVRDTQGHWWVGTGEGLYRYRGSGGTRTPLAFELVARYTARDGLPGDDIMALFEDSRGDVWISAVSSEGEELARWDRRVERLHRFGVADGVPAFAAPIVFAEDRSGAIWVGLRSGGLLRYRGNRFDVFGARDGFSSPAQALYIDHAGRLWVGTLEGLIRIDNPAEDRPRTQRYSSADGLAGDAVRGIAGDRQGQLYVGTSRGITRLDPQTDSMAQYTISDGLPSPNVLAVRADRHGHVWFATTEGISRLTPAPDPAPSAPPVRIAQVRVAGVSHPVPAFGAERIEHLRLSPSENHVEVDFFGLSRGARGALRYQYRLEGSMPTWSEPSERRTVNFASLSPGTYRFLVRAVSAAGVPSPQPAEMSFTVLPPIYFRWWFVALALALLTLGIVALYRMRVAQLVRVERVRGRIATDLHDDIGASLSQIAILAEVARQRAGAEHADPTVAEPLSRIAETSRGLVDSMSDIVWAINPSADSLSDLIHRMRRFAEDTLSADDIELVFRAEEPRVDLKLGADLRRELFLVLKESVTNIAKHARCTRVEIDVTRTRRTIRLRVHDNGPGFDPARRTDGNGLRSMRQRAAALGGDLHVQSSSTGTTIELEVNLTGAASTDVAEALTH